jgi:DNA topoisomerase-1
VADVLGNTAAVARSAYVDPRVVDQFENGTVVAGGREKDVRDLLREDS